MREIILGIKQMKIVVTAFAVRVFKEKRESILPAVLGCVESVTTEYLSW